MNSHTLRHPPQGGYFEGTVREKFERSEEEYDQMQNALDFALKSGKAELIAEMLRNGAA